MPTQAPQAAPAAPARDIIVDARNVSKQFGEQIAVQDATFQIPRGTVFGFIGPSGSGKTTTMRLLTGIVEPTSGELRVLGKDPAHFTQSTREQIGYMPQQFVLYPDLTVWENMNFAASLYGMGLRRANQLNEMLEFVELKDDKRKVARDLSGGMQRRLSLAATLAHNPELLFLDEPTAGIDPVLRRKFWDHFKTLQDQGRTLFVTTQYVGEAAYCDYVGIMAEGRLLMVETPDGLRKRAYGGEVIDMVVKEPVSFQNHLQPLRQLPFVVNQRVTRTGDNSVRLIVDEASTALPEILEWTKAHNVEVESIEEFLPPFDDVFIEIIQREPKNG